MACSGAMSYEVNGSAFDRLKGKINKKCIKSEEKMKDHEYEYVSESWSKDRIIRFPASTNSIT